MALPLLLEAGERDQYRIRRLGCCGSRRVGCDDMRAERDERLWRRDPAYVLAV